MNKQGLFRRLTKLFRSGPVIKRRVKNLDAGGVSSAFELFRKNQSAVYSSAMSAYGTYDRLARYSDFSEMEYTPEISSALDIYSEETVASDESGKVLHVFSENRTVQKLLEELFYDTLNVEFNLTPWVRNLVKYGDFFLFNDVDPKYGVINAYPMPISEVEREEGYDPKDPMAVRFRWITQGNQPLENWQVCHMRLMGNDAFLPYGSSVLESARRIWRQLILIEDAMLVYRIVRSPERRVFKIDVGNVPPEEIPNYMEQVQTQLKRSQVVDKNTGRVDLRYNPLSVDEDYFLPVRGSESGTDISSLPGGSNATAIEDVEYIQKKLFAALKIPKAYLGYDEGLGAKATLSQEDVRFSRTISRVQRTVIAELNKIAIIHLFCNGFEGEDLLDFTLRLSNPSTIAQQQKLELVKSRFEAATSATGVEGMVDRNWIRKNILKLTDDDIELILRGREEDKLSDLKVESVKIPEGEGEAGTDLAGAEAGASPEAGGMDMMASDDRNSRGGQLLTGDVNETDNTDFKLLSVTDENAPIRVQNTIGHIKESNDDDDDKMSVQDLYLHKQDQKRKRKQNNAGMEDLYALSTPDASKDDDSTSNPDGVSGLKDLEYEMNSDAKNNGLKNAGKIPILKESDDFDISEYLDSKITQNAKMTNRIKSALNSLNSKISNENNTISEKKIHQSKD